MSFSGMVKEELSRQIGTARHCRIAELAALIGFCGRLEHFPQGEKLKLQTENETVARKCFTLLQKTFNIEKEISVRENSHLKRVKVYVLEISDPEEIREILQATKLIADSKFCDTLILQDMLVVQQSCCKRAYIRGAFLASGSISDPEKGYHFEIVYPDERKAQQLADDYPQFFSRCQNCSAQEIICGLCEGGRADCGYARSHGGECGIDGSGEYPDTEGDEKFSKPEGKL